VHERLTKEHPDAVREIYRMIEESRRLAPEGSTATTPPLGLEANRKGLQMAIDWSYEQKIIPRRLAVEELFDEVTGALG
jgi:4,5-dihydroxyphthalate decarboxylase